MEGKNIMVDIETLGTKPGSIILSIGAVEFDLKTGICGKEFYAKIDVDSCLEVGLKWDYETILWWLKQSQESQKTITEHEGEVLVEVLKNFNLFVLSIDANACLWANSPRFDLVLLQAAYECALLPIAWDHFKERDVRTLAAFDKSIKANTVFTGIKHNAVDDCKHQIKYCSNTYNKILQQ